MFPAVLRARCCAPQETGACRQFAIRSAGFFRCRSGACCAIPTCGVALPNSACFAAFAARLQTRSSQHGLRTPDGSVGVLDTGTLDLESFLIIVDALPEGTWEFVCHPGYNDAELDQVRTRLRQSRETELALLTSPDARAALDRRGIELISYREL